MKKKAVKNVSDGANDNNASVPKKEKAPSRDKRAEKDERRQEQKQAVVINSSIITGPTIVDTIVGPIREWKPCPENLPNHPTMAFFGKRRTGKSTSITNIAFHCCQNIPFGLVMSDTAYAGYWDKIVPKKHIVQGNFFIL